MFRFLYRLFVRKPVCPRCDLLHQARQLVDQGYYVGALATARCELEMKLKTLVHAVGNERPDSWHSHAVAIFLHDKGLLTLSEARRTSAAIAIANAMTRNAAKCNVMKSHRMVGEIAAVVDMLDEALPRFARAAAIAA